MFEMMRRLFGRRSCAEVVAVLDGYCEGALDPKLARIIGRHLRGCASCEAFARTYRTVIGLTGELPADDIPPSIRRQARAALRARARRNAAGKGNKPT